MQAAVLLSFRGRHLSAFEHHVEVLEEELLHRLLIRGLQATRIALLVQLLAQQCLLLQADMQVDEDPRGDGGKWYLCKQLLWRSLQPER